MPTDHEYEVSVKQLNRRGLLRLWRQIVAGKTPGWAPGKAFEYLIIRAFELEGADVTYPYQVKVEEDVVEQIDGLVVVDAVLAIVESKDQTNPVNVEPLAKMRNQLLRRPSAAVGSIFSRSGFTSAAQILAQYFAPQALVLWEANEIEYMLYSKKMCAGLKTKYRIAVRDGVGAYNILGEVIE